MNEQFSLRVTLEGPEFEVESNYGPRVERKTLATFGVPVDPERAWHIYQTALNEATRSDLVIVIPDQDELIEKFNRQHGDA